MAKPILNDNTVYLIDGSGYIFRAFFAIRHLRSKSGVPTNAVYGFTTMLLKLLKEHKPKYVAIAFDRKEPTFRQNIYLQYKANRTAPPEDLVPQFALIHRVVEALNIKLLSLAGFEADDIIATMKKRAEDLGHEVIIVTGDKDLMQLVDDKTFLLDELRAARSGQELFIDAAMVKEELGVLPHQVVDLLALAGDTSDNVPGVTGIGRKTAAELLNEYGSLERIFELAPLIKQNSRRQKLVEGQALAFLSKQLVSLDSDAPVHCSIEDLKYRGLDQHKTRELFLELDFNRLLQDQNLFAARQQASDDNNLASPSSSTSPTLDRGNYRCINDAKSLEELFVDLDKAKKIAIAVEAETRDLDDHVIGIAFAYSDNDACYIPLAHKDGENVEVKLVQEKFAKLFSDDKKIFVAHNAKLTHKLLANSGFSRFVIGGDPMLASYLLYQDQYKHDLNDLSLRLCGQKLLAVDKKQLFSDLSTDRGAEIAAEKAHLVFRLDEVLQREIKASSLWKLYKELELPLEEVLSDMETLGVRIDADVLHAAKGVLKDRLHKLEEEAYRLAGTSFNLASPKQTADILFGKLALPSAKKTKTGFSTDSSVLEKLAPDHAVARVLLEHRMCAKLLNTYIETLPHLINKRTGRVHTNYNQFVAATGRLSSSDPNLQNIPIRTVEGREIRKAFVARPGYKLISLDYSQVELRILAFITKDPVLVDSFEKDQDVHRRTASEIFEIDSSDVVKSQRDAAKTINFGLLYGMGSHRLAQTLKIPRKEAQAYLDKYFEKYAGILRYKTEALVEARKNCEVRTLFGRKRALPELASNSAMERARGERIAINTPIQGTAADIVKIAMIETADYLKKYGDDAHLIMQVHDELIIEAKAEFAETIAKDVAKIMSHGHKLDLNLKVDYGVGDNWDDAH